MSEQFLISKEIEDGEGNHKTLLTSKALCLTIIREVCLKMIENELNKLLYPGVDINWPTNQLLIKCWKVAFLMNGSTLHVTTCSTSWPVPG